MKIKFFCAAFFSLLFFSCSDQNQPTPEATPGALSGEFSVSASHKVHFSQGNLQYVGTWQFANHQWDCFGSSQSDNHRDLFGWGTGDAPNKVSTDNNGYSTFVDWGTNAITNGGNKANAWRTLTKDEWIYLFYIRTNATTLFGLGSVNGVNGTILLPDDWTLPAGASFTASTTQGLADDGGYYSNPNSDNFSHNTYTAAQWAVMEANGAVFCLLQAAATARMWAMSDRAVATGLPRLTTRATRTTSASVRASSIRSTTTSGTMVSVSALSISIKNGVYKP